MALLSRVLNHHTDNSSRSGQSLESQNSSSQKRQNSSRFALNIKLESPPVVLFGQPNESTGSIISGVLMLEILSPKVFSPKSSNSGLEPISSRSSESHLTPVGSSSSLAPVEVELDSVVLLLVQTMHYSKPFLVQSSQISSCDKCLTRVNTLARWDALLERSTFPVGSHAYPFSHLIPGLLAATTKFGGSHSQTYIKYELIAVATSGSKESKLVLPVNILRSILRGPDRNSQRVFPPTEVTATAVLPNVIYPKSTFPVELRMENMINEKQDRRWRMRKLSWKLEEHTQVKAHACSVHEPKMKSIEEAHRKSQLDGLKLGLPAATGNDGPFSAGRHHLTFQALMYYGPPPVTSTLTRAEQMAATAAAASSSAPPEDDIAEEEEESLINRVADEARYFDQDFGPESETMAPESSNVNPSGPDDSRTTPLQQRENTSGANGSISQNASPHTSEDEPPQSSLFLDELRVVAHGDVKSGWKSDFSGKGRIELVADIVALDCSTGHRSHVSSRSSTDAPTEDMLEINNATISYDIEDPELGVYVSHVLVVEVIIAEEVVPQSKAARGDGLTPVNSLSPNSNPTGAGVPTGSARVLRMQFKVNITERSGLGVAWDDEVPPTYEDVRALSPPTYENLAASMPFCSTLNLNSISRPNPAVLYGVGDTPLVGSIGLRHYPNIDLLAQLEDGIQELRL